MDLFGLHPLIHFIGIRTGQRDLHQLIAIFFQVVQCQMEEHVNLFQPGQRPLHQLYTA